MTHLRTLLVVSLFAAGCADVTVEPEPQAGPTEVTTVTQAVVDADGPNWLAVGGGYVELAGGTDGEPDELAGRFALDGREVVATATGADRWIIAGAQHTQPIDADAFRLTEPRDALSGETIEFVATGNNDWLIGGSNGQLQLLDAQGEPTQTSVQVLSGQTASAAAFNGLSWLVGSSDGDVVVVNTSLDPPINPQATVDGGSPIMAITGYTGGWIAFTEQKAAQVSALGTPGPVSQLVTTGTITTAASDGTNVYVGTSDGRIGVGSTSLQAGFTFSNALSGAITKFESNGTDWIALGANGQAVRFDTSGALIGSPVAIAGANDRALVGARWTGTRWMVAVGGIGFIAFADDQLATPEPSQILGGAAVADANASPDGILVVGPGGAVQLLDAMGNSVAGPATAGGGAYLRTAAWNGDNWLVAGDGGAVQLVDAAGAPVGSSTTMLGGEDIEFASWSGEFFLIGGGNGMVQVLRSDGSQSGPPFEVTGATRLYDARWSGLDWLVVGTDGTAGAFARLVPTDSSANATIVNQTGALRAVDFNGIEFLTAGDDGLIQRVSAQGMPVDSPVDVLTGFDIHDVYFNGSNYIVGGEFGAVRRLGQDYSPLRSPIALLKRADVAAILWTTPRGFAGGLCLTDELCYEGPCVGGLANGQCCDSACDRACESCFEDDTGQPDGTCAPVVAGKQPPVKPGGATCQRQAEGTCGLTGMCDGAGECEFYGAEITCADAVCSLGQYTAIAVCDGAGACGEEAAMDCSPYAGCTIDGCVTSCNADQDCVAEHFCEGSVCVPMDDTFQGDDPVAEDESGGCCATTAPQRHDEALLLLAIGGLGLLRRRR